jgi:hypothetical protein
LSGFDERKLRSAGEKSRRREEDFGSGEVLG